LRYRGRNWLAPAQLALENGHFDGWAHPRLVEEVVAHPGHHVCTHSGTHIPYSDTETSTEAIAWDLMFARDLHLSKGLEWGQMIFPRNVVGHLKTVGQYGVTAYRDIDRQEKKDGRVGKLTRLLHEFLNLDAGDFSRPSRVATNGLVPLSGGKFLSAGIGIRRRIPLFATLHRIDVLLKFAAIKGTTVHFYTHPHNFINDPSMFIKLTHLLRTALDLGTSHGLRISTMKEEENALRSATQIQG
jgi:peptidoglycan/xylan/chitin deacetylase (PgdA/CDA1 family)